MRRQSLLWRLEEKAKGAGAGGGQGNVWEAPPPGRGRQGGEVLSAQAESRKV